MAWSKKSIRRRLAEQGLVVKEAAGGVGVQVMAGDQAILTRFSWRELGRAITSGTVDLAVKMRRRG